MTAQSKVYQLYADKLFSICLKYSRNYQDAEDTLQDSFLTIFANIKQYKSTGSFEGWLKRITINTALQKYREKVPLQLVEDIIENNVDDDTEPIEKTVFNLDILLEFIQKLPDRYRLVFNLYVLDNYTHKEISNLLQISENTSKSNLSRARKNLKKELQKYQQNAKK